MSVFLGATKGKKRISAKQLQDISEKAEMDFWKSVTKSLGVKSAYMNYDYDSTYELQQEMDKAIRNFIKYNK